MLCIHDTEVGFLDFNVSRWSRNWLRKRNNLHFFPYTHTHTHTCNKVDLNLLCQILVGKFTYVKFGRCGHLMAG